MTIGILSRDPSLYSTRRLAEAGRGHGIDMMVLDHLRCNIVVEGNGPHLYYGKERLPELDAIIPRIGASVTFYGAAVIEQFEMMGVFSPTSSSALIRSRNKLSSLQRLSKYGIGMPNTVFTDYMRDSDQLVHVLGEPPWIIKLLEGTQGLGVVLVENKGAAESVIEAFHKLKARIIVQEFIQEASGTDVRAFVVNGEVVGAMKRTANNGFRSNLHRGGSAEVIRLTPEEELTAISAARALELDIAGVDILQSARGPLVMEVNSSPGLEGIEAATGVDIADKIIRFIIEKTTTDV